MSVRGSLKYFAASVLAVGVMAGATLLAWADDWDAQWQLRPTLSVDRVHFVIRHSTALSHWSNGRDVSLDNFRGFSLAMLAAGGPAKFEYVGDAGRMMCQGNFTLGSGSGAFTFSPNADFVRELVRLGYDTPDDEQLFQMLVQNVDRKFARDIRDAGLHASAAELVQLRNHGINYEYIRDVRQAGYTDLEVSDLVQLRNQGVNAEFLRDLKADGFDLKTRDIVQLRNQGVGVEYLKDLKEAGYRDLSVREITQLRNNGVQADLLREAKRLGYDFTPQELTQLQVHGVNADYLRKIKDSGMRNLTAEQIAKLRAHGVD